MVAAGDLLTIRQALVILPVGRSTIYSLVEEGQRTNRPRPTTDKRLGTTTHG